MDFYKRVKELREEKGLSQKEVAVLLNVSHQFVSSWERDRNRPCYEILVTVADFFDVTIDYLLGREDEFGDMIKTKNI